MTPARLSSEPFDLILLDINLPDQTGWDVLRHLEKCGPVRSVGSTGEHRQKASPEKLHEFRPRVIVITAVRPQQSRLDEFQPAAVLLKPFPIAALLQLIERVLEDTHLPNRVVQTMTPDETGESSELHRTDAVTLQEKGDRMVGLADVLFLVVSAAAFAGLIAFVYACGRL